MRGAHGAIRGHFGRAARREGRKGEGQVSIRHEERLVTEGASGTVSCESVSQAAGKGSCQARKTWEELSWQTGVRPWGFQLRYLHFSDRPSGGR